MALGLLLREGLYVTIEHEALVVVHCPAPNLEEIATEIEHVYLGLALALDQLSDLDLALVGHLVSHEPFVIQDKLLATEGGV